MKKIVSALCVTIFAMIFQVVGVFADSSMIDKLSEKIAVADSEVEKSRLYLYRARNFVNIGAFDKAKADYDAALTYNHQGWIHLERGKFFLARKNFKQARLEASAAKKETPTLAKEAQRIIQLIPKTAPRKKQQYSNETIYLTKQWDENGYARRARPGSASRRIYSAKRWGSTSPGAKPRSPT